MSTSRPLSSVSAQAPSEIDADWLVVPVFEGDPPGASLLAPALEAEVGRVRESGGFSGKRFELLHAVPGPSVIKARNLVLVGAGPAGEFTLETARRVASAALLAARARGAHRLALVHRLPPGAAGPAIASERWVEAWAEGLALGEFDPGRYKSAENQPGAVESQLVLPGVSEGDLAAAQSAAHRARVIGDCTNAARALVNEPGNLLPPRVFAGKALELAAGTGLRVEVLDEQGIAGLRMGLITGVAQGSQEPPRLIVLEHAPASAPASPVLGLVGKGVTFDSGGISIKTAAGMERMKDDMAGGAAVMAALRAIALLGLPVRVIGVVPSVENMPSGGAIRPGDVLRAASGRTVEVIDTDAEGRLILGDALWYARRLGATHLVDIATLTGACAVALGKTTTGLFGRPDDWVSRVRQIADGCGERCWPMPVFDDYRELLKSDIADTVNVGGRYGGAITAALFVGEFARDVPWVHMDVAGTAWSDEAKAYLPKGPTGVGVRTFVELAAALAGSAGEATGNRGTGEASA